MKKIKFIPGDTNYRWDLSSNSPFLKRSLAIFSLDRKAKAKSLIVKKRYYEMFFANEKETYLSRNQHVHSNKSSQKDAKYLEEQDLKGSLNQIEFSINILLERIISHFEENPQSLFAEVKIINRICLEEGFSIPIVEAFYRIKNWDEFMQLLNSFSKNKSPFKFELMIAAIVQYSEMCGGGGV